MTTGFFGMLALGMMTFGGKSLIGALIFLILAFVVSPVFNKVIKKPDMPGAIIFTKIFISVLISAVCIVAFVPQSALEDDSSKSDSTSSITETAGDTSSELKEETKGSAASSAEPETTTASKAAETEKTDTESAATTTTQGKKKLLS